MNWEQVAARFRERYPDITDAELQAIRAIWESPGDEISLTGADLDKAIDVVYSQMAGKSVAPVTTPTAQTTAAKPTGATGPAATSTPGTWDENPAGATIWKRVPNPTLWNLLGKKTVWWHPAGEGATEVAPLGAGGIAPTIKDVITTDPTLGWKTFTRGGTTYVNKPDPVLPGAWKGWEELSRAPAPPSQWIQEDGTVSSVRTAKTIGFVDKSGIPQQLDALFRPQPVEEAFPMPTGGSDQPWIMVNGRWQQNPDYIRPQERAAADRTEQLAREKMAQDYALSAETIRRDFGKGLGTAALDKLAAMNEGGIGFGQAQSPQTRPITATSGPGDWINYWQQQQANIDPRTGTAWQTPAAYAARVNEWFPSDQLAKLQGATNVNPERQQVWEPSNLNTGTGRWRPETDQEYTFRTRTVPIRDLARGEQVNPVNFGIGPGGEPPQPNWIAAKERELAMATQGDILGRLAQASGRLDWLTPAEQQAISSMAAEENAARVAEFRRTNPIYTGPQIPDWATGVVQAGGNRLNLGTLGRAGNVIRPVNAGTYMSWTPSQRAGYEGLVTAQKGVYTPDFIENVQRQWRASAPGELARRTVRSF